MVIKKLLKNKVFQNASWIMVGRIGQAICGLIVTMLTARYLGPTRYGLISYAASIVVFVAPIMQLGLNEILVQEIIANPEDEGKIIGTSMLMNFISAIACITCILIFVFIINQGERKTVIICGLYSILLLFQAFDLIRYWFQAKYLAKYISIICLVSYSIASIYKIMLLVTGKSIYWFAISNAIDYFFVSVLSIYAIKKIKKIKFIFSKEVGIRLFQKSKYYIISGLMINVFAQTDKIMLKILVNETATGYYTSAVTCAAVTSFVFVAIIDSIRPSIFAAKNINQERYDKYISLLYAIVIYLSLFQSIIMSIFSPMIIKILYGNSYEASIKILRVIVWYTTFSYVGAVRNIWILAEQKQKYIWKINFSGAVLNVILNLCMIPTFGVIGAAIASIITQIFTNVIIGYIIPEIRYNNTLMLRGLKIIKVFDYFKKTKLEEK